MQERDKGRRTPVCVPGGSLYLLPLIWLVAVCRACGGTQSPLPIPRREVSNPRSGPVSPSTPPPLSRWHCFFSPPLLRCLSSYGLSGSWQSNTERGGKPNYGVFVFLNQRLYLNMMDGRVCSGYAPVSSVKGFCVFLFLSFHPKSALVALMCCHVGQRLLYFYRF